MSPPIPIIDTHQHLIHPERWAYSWTNDVPALKGNPYRYTEYLDAIKGTGIEASVFMETTPDDPFWKEETRFIEELVREPGSLILGQIANCRPEHAGFEPYLDSIGALSVKGLRRFLHAAPEGTVDAPEFLPNLRKLSKRNLPFDLCVFEKQLPMAERIAAACPDVQLVLDHCGVPEINGGDFKTWCKAIQSLSRMDNVACKISGVLAYCPPGKADTDTVRPYVEHCIDCFGWDRLLWGSDWPVVTTASTLTAWVSISRAIVSTECEENQQKLFNRNARRIYHLDT